MSNRARRPMLPGPEYLDRRILPSLPAVAIGRVSQPGGTGRTTAQATPGNLTKRRPSTLIEVAAQARSGSALEPTLKSVKGSSGKRLPTYPLSESGRSARLIAKVRRPGGVTTTVTGRDGTTGAYQAATTLAGDVNGDGRVNQTDATIILAAYPSVVGRRKYDPRADLNHNGQVGQSDLRILIRNLPAPRKQPLRVLVNLAPADSAHYKHMPTNLGGHTFQQNVTIVIRTTPGSLVLEDSGLGDYSFSGRAAIANDRGLARFNVQNQQGLTSYNFLVIDPFGNQTVRTFPVFWLSRAYQANA